MWFTSCRCTRGCCELWGKPSNVWEEEMSASCPQDYYVWPVFLMRLKKAGAKMVVEESREAETASRTLAQHFQFFLLNALQSQVIIWNINWCPPVFPTTLSTTQADENSAFVSSGKAWHQRKWERAIVWKKKWVFKFQKPRTWGINRRFGVKYDQSEWVFPVPESWWSWPQLEKAERTLRG